MSWFYEENGTRKGPLSEPDMHSLVKIGTLTHSTLCWTESFGAEWHPAGSCSFWPRQPNGIPPALPAGRVPKRWAWLSIFAPLLGDSLVTVMNWFFRASESQTHTISLLLGFILVIAAMLTDRRALMAAGFRPGSPLWVLIPPLYFWRRIHFVGSGMALLSLSLLIFLFQFIPAFSFGWHLVHAPGSSGLFSHSYDV